MKKTIIALMALTGMASAETVIFNLGGGSITSSYEDISIVTAGSLDNNGAVTESVTLDETSLSIKFQNGTGTARQYNGTLSDNWDNTLGLPDKINLGISVSDMDILLSSSAQITGTKTGKGEFPGISTLTLTGLNDGQYELISFMGRASGNTTATTLTLEGAENVSVTSYIYSNGAWTLSDSPTLGYVAAGSSSAMVNVYTFEAKENTPINLTYTGSVSYNGDSPLTTNQNIQFIALKSIPEPTTATLSLLALAGLAARRRRR